MSGRYKPEVEEFLVESETLKTLRPRFERAVDVIRSAIDDNRMIMIRHHADCDGYCSALALEHAIFNKIVEKKGRQYAWRYFKRLPSKTPYYDYTDAVKDMANAVTDRVFYEKSMPLLIVVDNGSSQEDYVALKKAKLHGAKLLVVDHHDPGELIDGKAKVDELLDAHINPHLEGFDGSLCTGMLCVELARMISSNAKNLPQLAAVAGVGDKCQGPEFDSYVSHAVNAGFDEEYLRKMSAALNWEGYHLGFYDGKQLIHTLLGERTKEQEEMVELAHSEITKGRTHILPAVEKYAEVHDFGSLMYVTLDLDSLTQWGSYFSAGKITSLAFGHFEETYPEKKVVVAGIGPVFITFRAKKGIINEGGEPFDVNRLEKYFQETLPYALVSGGGHDVAGTLKFVGAAKKELVELLHSVLSGMK